MTTRFASSLLATLLAPACSQSRTPVDIRPVVITEPVSADADDPAIWVNPADPARSLIVGTNKVPAPWGALVVWGLDGKIRQTVAGLDQPNNVDVEYGILLRSGPVDIAVVTERLQRRLRVYRITAEGLTDISSGGGLPVFVGQSGAQAEPMGIGIYRRPRDLTVFAIVSRKSGPRNGHLWEYELRDDGAGRVAGFKVREFGGFSGAGEIEAVAVDDALGHVYYADEGEGIHKWHADPDHPDAGRELANFARSGFLGDREGIAIYARPDGTGYIVCTDQIPRNSKYYFYRREGKPGAPHDHSELVRVVWGGADATDGIEVTSAGLGPHFPSGVLVAMNSAGRNFFLYRWEDIQKLIGAH